MPVVSTDEEPESFPSISEGGERSLSESGVWISTPTSPSSAALLEALPEGVEPIAPRTYSSGESMEGGAAQVLLRAAAEHPVAVVSIRTSVRRWQLTLREDALIGVTARPEDPRFTFRNALATSGMVKPEQMEDAEEAARTHGVTLRDVLVARRMLRYRDLEALDRTRATYALTLLLSETVERWEAHGFGALRGSPPSIAPFAHRAWDELHQTVTQRETAALERAMAPRMLHRPTLRTDRFIDLRSMQLDPRDARVATEVLDGTTSVARAIAGSQLSRRAVLALVMSLDLVGMWRWTEVRATQSRIARAWDAIVSKHDALTRSNPFDLLGTHWSSDDALVHEAYTHLLHTLDLDYVIAEGTPEEAETAKRVREGLTVARETLKHRDARTAVRRSISSESERKSALSLYDQRAEMAMMRGEHSAALESLRRVVELDPEHATARRALQEARLRGER